MYPAEAAAHDRRIGRLLKLREKLEDMPLSDFTVGDLEAIYRVMRMDVNKEAREEDLARLEKKVRVVKKR
jgi:hypothetical protein